MKPNVYDEGQVRSGSQRRELGKPAAHKTKSAPKWLVPAALLLFSAIPLTFGALRLNELASGAAITPANARFFASPLPVVVHIVSAALFALLGVFQFVTGFQRRRLGWHRAAGRVLVVCGLLVGLSGIWMTLFYARPAGSGDLLFVFRLLFGSAMVGCITLGFTTIRRGDVFQHRAWMMRAYAIGLGAGTQVLTGAAEGLLISQSNDVIHALAMGAAWVINLAIAEWAIRRLPAQRARTAAARAASNSAS